MKCTICGNTALRHVGKKGYCKDHTAEAWAQAGNDRPVGSATIRGDGSEDVALEMAEQLARKKANGWVPKF
jgi:hypothetical protein